jgi:hypothetical protein
MDINEQRGVGGAYANHPDGAPSPSVPQAPAAK